MSGSRDNIGGGGLGTRLGWEQLWLLRPRCESFRPSADLGDDVRLTILYGRVHNEVVSSLFLQLFLPSSFPDVWKL